MKKKSDVRVHVLSGGKKSVLKTEQYAGLRASDEQRVGETIPWPVDPKKLYTIYESSSLLQPNISAYIANVDQLGEYFAPVVQLGTDTDDALLREVAFEESVVLGLGSYRTPDDVPSITIDDLRGELLAKQLSDRAIAESFLRNCGGDLPFTRIRAELRQDLEVTGNGFWEVLRDSGGKIRRFVRILPSEIEACPLSEQTWPCAQWVRQTRRRVVQDSIRKRIRLYKVTSGYRSVYLKEFRCRAVVSSLTGKIFESMDEFLRWKRDAHMEQDEPANEVLHFRLLTNLSEPYGLPRWLGALREVLGTMAVAEFNHSIFSNGLMLPLLILVSGGTLSPESINRLRTYLEGMKGVENAHRAAVLEATSGTSSTVPTVEVKELGSSGADAKFLEYDKRNEDRVGSQFRISDIVRGNTNTVQNRATAEAALMQADSQVFAPIRAEFDWIFTTQILPEIGVTSLEFVSRGVTHTDAALLGKTAIEAVKASILTPNEARELLERVFEREFSQVDETWATVPPDVFRVSGVQSSEKEPSTGDAVEMSLVDEITALLEKGKQLATTRLGDHALTAELLEALGDSDAT